MVQLAFLLAIMVILTFTPLGFIMLPSGAITIMHIPVIIGAVTMGPLYGGILGGSFGLLSMIKATVIAGYLFLLLRRFDKHNVWSVAVSAAVASIAHTVMVLGCMSVFFGGITIIQVLLTLLTLNGSLELLAAVVITTAVCNRCLPT